MATDKLSIRIADAMEQKIVESGWPIGSMIGSEAELIEEFGASRAVIREAVLVLEQRQIASRRPGPGGGVVVRAPKPSGVIATVARYLEYVGLTSADLLDVRTMLENHSLSRAIREDDGVAALALVNLARSGRGITADRVPEHTLEFHKLLGQMSQSPILLLFSHILHEIASDLFVFSGSELTRDVIEALVERRIAIAEAVRDRDEARAQAEMGLYLEEVTRRFT